MAKSRFKQEAHTYVKSSLKIAGLLIAAGFVFLILVGLNKTVISGASHRQDANDAEELGTAENIFVTLNENFVVDAEIASVSNQISKGLMFRESLGYNEGMFFVYSDSKPRTFWMKNTLIPLDMIFIDENFTVVNIHNAVPCKADPCHVYNSGADSKYVLEINGGLAEQNNITIGNTIIVSESENKIINIADYIPQLDRFT
jgi:uncharacterized membrane protein (UPF0127 family)